MMDNKIPRMMLSNGHNMPVIGLGTAAIDVPSEATKMAVIEAIKAGYGHFDTASAYGTEEAQGEAIEKALKLGLVASRDQLFITSKLWITDNHPDRVIPALQKSLGLLNLEYLDLYLIHLPISTKTESSSIFPTKENIEELDIKGVWEAMEECQKLGLTKSIGVSNFSINKLDSLLSIAIITPSVNQIEMNPTWQQMELRNYCKEKGIFITTYSPLGASSTIWGDNRILNNEVLIDIAKSHDKTVAQVALRWLHEQRVGYIVKSYNKVRMKENLDIFDWSLTENDLEKISQIKQMKANNKGPLFDNLP